MLVAFALCVWLGLSHAQAADAPGGSLETATLRGSQDFELTVNAPLLYATGVVRDTTGASLGDRPDLHANPDLVLKWTRQMPTVRLAASIGLLADRYSKFEAGGSNGVQARLKLAWTDGVSDLLIPYALYVGAVDYSGDLRSRDDVLQDVAFGVASAIGFDQGGEPIAYRDTSEPGQSWISLDMRAGRRFADPRDLQNLFVTASVEFGGNLGGNVAFGLTPVVRARLYESYHGRSRRDLRVGGLARLAWTPAWLKTILPRSELSFGLGHYRTFSSLRVAAGRQWEVGPALEFGQKF